LSEYSLSVAVCFNHSQGLDEIIPPCHPERRRRVKCASGLETRISENRLSEDESTKPYDEGWALFHIMLLFVEKGLCKNFSERREKWSKRYGFRQYVSTIRKVSHLLKHCEGQDARVGRLHGLVMKTPSQPGTGPNRIGDKKG